MRLHNKIWTALIALSILLGAILAPMPPVSAQAGSAASSQVSATPAIDPDQKIRAACLEVIEELKAARTALGFLPEERKKAKELQLQEQAISAKLRQLRTMDAEEKAILVDEIENLKMQRAGDRQIIATLKKQKRYPAYKKVALVVGGITLGVGIGAIIAVVLDKD